MPAPSCLAPWVLLMSVPFQAPFQTVLPWSLSTGAWEVVTGVSWVHDERPPFFTDDPGAVRNAWHADLLDATYGVGPRTEVQVQAGLQGFHEESGVSTWGVEDARLSFTHQLPFERWGTALRFEVKLPNASNDERLGTDETDTLLLASTGQHGTFWGWAGEAGRGMPWRPPEPAPQGGVLPLGAAGSRSFPSPQP